MPDQTPLPDAGPFTAALPSWNTASQLVASPQGCKADRIDLSRGTAVWSGEACLARSSGAADLARRCLDVVVSATALLFLAPLLCLIAMAVALTSPGPVLYVQERTGLNGRPFNLLKFRSMRADAEAGGAQWAAQRDSRVTPLGRALRLSRMDELPQLLNVLGGSMSLVGPRPERPVFVAQLQAVIPHFGERTRVRPGITGWAQVNYPYGASVEDARQKLAYDLYYLQHRSLLLDLRIMLMTLRVICTFSGAR